MKSKIIYAARFWTKGLCFLLLMIFQSFFSQDSGYEKKIHQDTGVSNGNFGPLNGASNHVAHYFPASQMTAYQSWALDYVEIYIATTPVHLELKIYGQGTELKPGPILFSKVIAPATIPILGKLVRIELDTPIVISGQDLWIGYEVTNSPSTGCIGTDTGPMKNGLGNWRSLDGQNWSKFSFLNKNWIISGHLKAPLTEGNDIGVSAIINPITGANLGEEEINIDIKNYGTQTQSNIPYSVTWDNQNYNGIYAGTIESDKSVNFTLPVKADLKNYGIYNFSACTTLAGDQKPQYDCTVKTVENKVPKLCTETLYTQGCSMDRISNWALSNIQVDDIQCPADGTSYLNLKDKIHDLKKGQTYPLTVTSTYINHYVAVWIDYDDNLEFTPDEYILKNANCPEKETPYNFNITIPENATEGTHLMRMRSNYAVPVESACDTYDFGIVLDFTVNLSKALATNETAAEKLSIFPNPASEKITVNNAKKIAKLMLIDYAGRIVIELPNINKHLTDVNVSSLPSGSYILQITDQEGKTTNKNIIVSK